MATTASKSSSIGQVAPDVIIARRLRPLWGIGKERTKDSPLYSFDEAVERVGLELVLDRKTGTHRIVLGDKLNYLTSADTIQAIGSTRLLSSTAKMSAPSFSLPAGPPSEGGSCSMANKKPGDDTIRRNAKGRPYICDMCYSLKGNYYYASTQFGQMLRLVWLQSVLDAGGPTALAEMMILTIVTLAAEGHMGKDAGERLSLELGIWSEGNITAPIQIKGRKPTRIPLPVTKLPKDAPWIDTREFFQEKGVREGDICGFFRVHDSGDLSIPGGSKRWIEYTEAWIQVAEALPFVEFWLPTRIRGRAMTAKLQEGMLRAPNFMPRISALFVDDKAGGSLPMSLVIAKKESQLSGFYLCPVVPQNQSSCGQEGCRACWIAPKLIPGYKEH